MHQLATGAGTLPLGGAPGRLGADGDTDVSPPGVDPAGVDPAGVDLAGVDLAGVSPAARTATATVARPPAAPAPPTGRPRGRARQLLGAAGPELLVLVLALGVFGYRVGTPSPWRDEGATMVIAARPLGEILQLVRHLDLVHAAYYLLVHGLLVLDRPAMLGDAVPAVRAVSVVAASLTAVILVRIGRRLGATSVGLAAALALVASPLATRYAQEARSYALVMLATTLATLLLLRAAAARGGDRRGRRAWALYAVVLAVTALLNVIALLVLLAHAAYVRARLPRPVRRRWLLATTGGIAVAGPFVVATFLQRGQVDWLFAPALGALPAFYAAQYHELGPLVAVLVAALLLVALPARFARRDPRRLLPPRIGARLGATNTGALALGLAWAVLPVLALWLVSQGEPLFTWRYVVFTLPGTALVVGSLATAVRPLGLLVPVVVLAVVGLSMQGIYRDPHIGHAEDMEGVGEYVAAHARSGDAVLWVPGGPGHMRTLQQLYPERYAGLIDVALERSGAATATITGVEKEPEQIAQALKKRKRVWLISTDGASTDAVDREKVQLLLDGYRIARVDVVHKFQVTLWQKAAPATG